MGKTLDAFLGRNFKVNKLKTLTKLAISRVAILKNQRQAVYSHTKSDVVELLKLGHHESALLRVGLVIKDRNMIDMFVMVEEFCHLLSERAMILHKSKECPEELKEAIASLIFASSRCGDFPELLEIRGMFVSRYGKEFAARIVELRNGCGVNPKIMQKLSTRQPNLDSRLKALKDIASENDIVLHLEEENAELLDTEKLGTNESPQQESNKSFKFESNNERSIHVLSEELISDESISDSMKSRKKYRDVAAAAQEAFVSAAYAAQAARAAVELSQFGSRDNDEDDGGSSGYPHGRGHISSRPSTPMRQSSSDDDSEDKESKNPEVFKKIDQIVKLSFTPEAKDTAENSRLHIKDLRAGFDRTSSTSSSEDFEPVANRSLKHQFDDDQINIQSNIWDNADPEAELKFPNTGKHSAFMEDDSNDDDHISIHSKIHNNADPEAEPKLANKGKNSAFVDKDSDEDDQTNIHSKTLDNADPEAEPKLPKKEKHSAFADNGCDDEDEDGHERPQESPVWIPMTMAGRYDEKNSRKENNEVEKKYGRPMSMRTRR